MTQLHTPQPTTPPEQKPKPVIGWKSLAKRFFTRQNSDLISLPAPLAIAATAAIWLYGKDTLSILTAIIQAIFSIFPSLTGLVLAGYALMLGAMPSDLRQKMKFHDHRHQSSLLERLNNTFSAIMCIEVGVLVIAFIFHIIAGLHLTCSSGTIATAVNSTACGTLILFSLIAFRGLYSIIINVFNFGQILVLTEEAPRKYRIKIKSKSLNNNTDEV